MQSGQERVSKNATKSQRARQREGIYSKGMNVDGDDLRLTLFHLERPFQGRTPARPSEVVARLGKRQGWQAEKVE
jgi:hypothetical protein